MSDPYFGPYRGIVTDNKDPQRMMRIKVSVPDVLGPGVESWAESCVPPKFRLIPEVGSAVWIEFEHGNPDYPVWIGMRRIAR